MKDVSKRIKELREEKNLSQEALAEKLFVTRQAVSNWETKKTRPDIETLEAMSRIFEIDIMEFLYGNDGDEKERRKKLIQIHVFGICLGLALILQIFITPALQDMLGKTYLYIYSILVVISIIITQIFYGCAVPFLLSLLNLKNDIYIKNTKVRKALLYVGIGLSAVCVIAIIIPILRLSNSSCPVLSNLWVFSYWLAMYGHKFYITSIIGALLYLGIKKGKTQR